MKSNRARLLLLSTSLLTSPALAEQGTIVGPLTGPHTMAEVMAVINGGLLAIQSRNSGTAAPANGPAAAPVHFQDWCDTTANPVVCKVYDGAQWLTIGQIDTTTHKWLTPIADHGGQVFNVSTYASPQAAVDVAIGLGGGEVFWPCGDYTLPSTAIGLNVDNSANIRLKGPGSTNSGGSSCIAIRYNGTGTAISARSSIGFRFSGLELVTGASATVIGIDMGHSALAADSAFWKIEDSTFVGGGFTGIGINTARAIDGEIRNNSFGSMEKAINGNDGTGTSYTAGITIVNNWFNAGMPYHIYNAGQFTMIGNAFEGPSISTYGQNTGAGFGGGCFSTTWIGNIFSDSTVSTPWINATCLTVTSQANIFGLSNGQTGIKIGNSSGTLSTDGDQFEGGFLGYGYDIGTGNNAKFSNWNLQAGGANLYAGTPGTSIVQQIIGSSVITSTLTMGYAGFATGVITFLNTGNGSLSLHAPNMGALGLSDWTLPIATDIVVGNSLAATLTNKSMSGSANTFTNIPIAAISGLGTGIATWLATPSSANLRAALTDETGTGAAYFQNGDIGTPSAGVATNLSGTAASLTAGHVTTNAAMTGDVTSNGTTNATTLVNIPSATPMAGSLLATNIAAPATPASGKILIYGDSTFKNVNMKNDLGTVTTMVAAKTAVATQFLTALATSGVLSSAQPAFSDLSGSATAAQMPAFSGDATTSAGATVITFNSVNPNNGAWGSATQSPTFTVGTKGLIVAASNTTITPAVTSITGLGTNVATWLATASSANLRAALTDETGTGLAYFQGGDIGSPSAAGTMPAFTLGGSVSGGGNSINNVLIGTISPLAGTFAALIANAGLSVTGTNTTINNQNGTSNIVLSNNSSGLLASTLFQASNGTNQIQFGMRGLNATAYGALASNTAFIYGATDFTAMSDGGDIILATGGSAETGRLKGTAGNFSVVGSISSKTPVTLTGTSATQGTGDADVIFNASGTFTYTLLAASSWNGREIKIKSIAAQTINSASSNVVPLAGGAAGTALLASGAGKWARLKSDGSSWITMAGN